MNGPESVSFPLATSMLVGALVSVPILGWWPLVGVVAAVGSAVWITSELR